MAVLGTALPGWFSGVLGESERIKIGQIGTKHSHAAGKIETIRKLGDVFELVGIVEPDSERKKEVMRDPVYQDLQWMSEEELFNKRDLRAVAVEPDLEDLVPTGMRCIDAGLHIHLDKPPGKSIEDLKKICEKAKQKNLTVQMGYMFRYNPAFQFCLKAVKEGWLGDIFEIDGVISKVIGNRRRPHLANTYGGAMMLLGCHLLDIAIAILGKPHKINNHRKQTFPDRDNLFDNELLVLDYPKASATIRSTLVEVEGSERRQFVVCGTKGTIEIKPLEPPRLMFAADKSFGEFQEGYQLITLKEMPGRYDHQLLDFAAVIRGEKSPDFTMDHDILVQELLLKASELD
jgi:predicted dehydrogenase